MSVVIDGTLGITSPAETVQGALTTTGNTILGDSSADTLNVGNGGLVKDASGNVGIGTASPVAKLDVRGILAISNSAASYWALDRNDADGALTFVDTTTERMRIDTSGNLLFNSGYGSAATAYGCRAWVNFNGTGTVAIRASGNVSSITDNAVGDYTVNFTTALVDINYSASGIGSNVTTDGRWILEYGVPRTTSAFRVASISTTQAFIDGTFINLAFFR